MKKGIIHLIPILLAANILLFHVSPSLAGGGKNYPLGAEDFLSGAVPPPGFYFLNYAYYYKGNDLADDSGDDIEIFDEAEVKADVLRFLWVSDKQIAGGFYGQHLFIPFLDVDVDFKQPVGAKGKSHYSDSGVPYVIYSPFILSWHLMEGKLHLVTSLVDTYIPMGNEEDGNLANVGRNFWGFEPVLAATWMPTKNLELSLKMMYDFYTSQDDYATPFGDVDRDPGQEFHFDYSISYALNPSWRVGVNGYYYQQTTKDDYDEDDYANSPLLDLGVPMSVVTDLFENEEKALSRVFAIGPGLWFNHKNIFLSLKSQYESNAKTMTEGYNVWFKFIYGF